MSRRALTPRHRLHAHIRQALDGQPAAVIAEAIAIADAIHLDGLGHMQTALDAALAHANCAKQLKQAAA